jgi:hypothetical protein
MWPSSALKVLPAALPDGGAAALVEAEAVSRSGDSGVMDCIGKGLGQGGECCSLCPMSSLLPAMRGIHRGAV